VANFPLEKAQHDLKQKMLDGVEPNLCQSA